MPRTIGANYQHHWCGPSTRHVLSIKTSVENEKKESSEALLRPLFSQYCLLSTKKQKYQKSMLRFDPNGCYDNDKAAYKPRKSHKRLIEKQV